MKNRDFVQLHNHTEHSLLDGAIKLERLCKGAQESGYKALAITDHGNMDGAVRFSNLCAENGLQGIYGVELYLLENWEPEFKDYQKNLHLTIHAKNAEGFQALMKGLSYANLEGVRKAGYAARPFLPLEYPLEAPGWRRNVVISTGCVGSPFWNTEGGIGLLERYSEVYGEDLYAETMPLDDIERQKTVNKCALEMSRRLGIKPIVTCDAHYLRAEDYQTHEVLLAVSQHGVSWDDPKRWKFDSKKNYLQDANEVYHSLRRMHVDSETAKRCILNTREIAEKCTFKLERIPVELPRVFSWDEKKYLVKKCMAEMSRRGFDKNNTYNRRLEYELDVIINSGFTRYILLVADVVSFAKEAGILVGPGRGSVGGSLVAYLMHITEVDPIKYGLVFERFLAAGRVDLPDIDLDFEDRKRYMIENYLREKYGEWHVAHVATFGTMRGRQAVQDVSRVFGVPRPEVMQMTKCILFRPDNDARAESSISDSVKIFKEAKEFKHRHPNVIKHAIKLEGQVRSAGVHAAGLVVSKRDLRKHGNCYLINRKGKITVNWDKRDLEFQGLMKLDVLGLSTLSVMSAAKDLIFERHGKTIDFYQLSLDDPKVYKEIAEGSTVCGFQIGSKGLQQYCAELKVDEFSILADAIALWRPGCLQAGITKKYSECRNKRERPKYYNSVHKQITGGTQGQIIYQEQVMFLLSFMAGFPWEEADKVRKIIGKKEGFEAWGEYKEKFVKGCVKKKMLEEEEAEEFFDNLRFFSQYAFNLSHSIEYAMLAYLTMWLKVYYPTEFICAYLDCGNVDNKESASEEEKIDIVLKEGKRLGIDVKLPDINKSLPGWKIIKDKKLLAGLAQVANCGPKAQETILEARAKMGGPFQNLQHFIDNIDRRRCNKRVVEMLIKAGAFDNILSEDDSKLWKIHFEELYAQIGTKNKLSETLEGMKKNLEHDWKLNEDKVFQYQTDALNFNAYSNIMGPYRKLAQVIRDHLHIHNVGLIKKELGEMSRLYIAQAMSLKFSYQEKAKKASESLGGVFGNLDDGTGFVSAVYPHDLYTKRQKTIERLRGEAAVFRLTKPERFRGASINKCLVEDVVTLDSISRGKPGFLKLDMLGEVPKDFPVKEYREAVHSCKQCPLYKGCRKPVPATIGNNNILILGEAPGGEEDDANEGFIGKSGQLLFRELKRAGIDREDCIIGNCVCCRPPGNKLKTPEPIKRCPWITILIETLKPKFILSCGNSPLYLVKGLTKGITALSGKTEFIPRFEAWTTFSIHPASVLYDVREMKTLRLAVREFATVITNLSR